MWEQSELAGEDYSAWWKAKCCTQLPDSAPVRLQRPPPRTSPHHPSSRMCCWSAVTILGGAAGGGGAGGGVSVRPWAATCREYRQWREGTSEASAGCRVAPKVRHHITTASLCFTLFCCATGLSVGGAVESWASRGPTSNELQEKCWRRAPS